MNLTVCKACADNWRTCTRKAPQKPTSMQQLHARCSERVRENMINIATCIPEEKRSKFLYDVSTIPPKSYRRGGSGTDKAAMPMVCGHVPSEVKETIHPW